MRKRPLVPWRLAAPVAAALSFAAGHVSASGEGSRRLVDFLGLKLPLVTQIVLDSPSGVCLATLALALGVVACAHFAPPPTWSLRAALVARALACSIAALGAGAAFLILIAYPLPLTSVHLPLQR